MVPLMPGATCPLRQYTASAKSGAKVEVPAERRTANECGLAPVRMPYSEACRPTRRFPASGSSGVVASL